MTIGWPKLSFTGLFILMAGLLIACGAAAPEEPAAPAPAAAPAAASSSAAPAAEAPAPSDAQPAASASSAAPAASGSRFRPAFRVSRAGCGRQFPGRYARSRPGGFGRSGRGHDGPRHP